MIDGGNSGGMWGMRRTGVIFQLRYKKIRGRVERRTRLCWKIWREAEDFGDGVELERSGHGEPVRGTSVRNFKARRISTCRVGLTGEVSKGSADG